MSIRNTIQRRIVLNTVMELANHPTPENVYEEIRRKGGTLSRSTVYRNLKVLQKNGQLKKLDIPGSSIRYDGNLSAHNHIFCTVCGKIGDISCDEKNTEVSLPQATDGWSISGNYSVFFGLCPDCNKNI